MQEMKKIQHKLVNFSKDHLIDNLFQITGKVSLSHIITSQFWGHFIFNSNQNSPLDGCYNLASKGYLGTPTIYISIHYTIFEPCRLISNNVFQSESILDNSY